MKNKFSPLKALCFSSLLIPFAALAGEHEIHEEVFMFKTGDAEIVKADVSDLVVGESRTLTTKSGKTIDILRGMDGYEIYIDGELQDLGMDGDQWHGEDRHVVVHREVSIDCESDVEGDCDHEAILMNIEDYITDADDQVVTRHIEVICDDADNCDESVWVSEDGEVDLKALHEAGSDHEVIIIRKDSITSN